MKSTAKVAKNAPKSRPKTKPLAKSKSQPMAKSLPKTKAQIKAKSPSKAAPASKTVPQATLVRTPITSLPVKLNWAGRVPQITPGTYSDGLPLHEVQYLSFKMMLRPNHFTSRDSLFSFAKVIQAPAKECGVGFSTAGFRSAPLKIREVLFVDTPDFRLYNSSFILRRRIPYKDGFPVGDPEIVFKYRNADIQTTAETDVRPQIYGDHRVKFKCQALPLKEKLGGIRMLYSHNVQFPRSATGLTSKNFLELDTLVEIFPVLERIRREPGETIQLVNDAIIEEVLQDIGELDFGQGVKAKCDLGIWRTRGEHRPLIGEFSFQIRFKDRKELALEAMQRAEAFFVQLQFAAQKYIALQATKTGVVYRLLGNPPNSNE